MNTTTTDKTDLSLVPPMGEDAPPSATSYEAVRFNALKHGILSRYTVLSHENHVDYQSLVTALMDEHLPAGATEQHLIEELVSVIWRKRRVLQAEGATINQGMTCRTCTHRFDVTLWGCWMATNCRMGLVICANCPQHKGQTT